MILDSALWWTGALAWALGAYILLHDFVLGFIEAVSWSRWLLNVLIVNNEKASFYLMLPKQFFKRWWEFSTGAHSALEWHGKRGYWKGVGDWQAYKSAPDGAAGSEGSPAGKGGL